MAEAIETSPALRVQQLGKEYKLYDTPRQRLKALLTGTSTHRSHWALQGVSCALHRGQCLGVIGDNGAGKSSLLKLMAGTMQPSVGSIERVGRVTAYQSVLLQGAWPLMQNWLLALMWVALGALFLEVLLRRSRDQLVDWL